MLEADKKKSENIIEYLLYMYHTEDVIRSCQLNLDLIKSAIITPSELKEEDKAELYQWYTQMVYRMQEENIEDRGHLNELIEIIGELSYVHKTLIQSEGSDAYRQKYEAASPHLIELSKKSSSSTMNPIELAVNGVYGIFTLKLKGQEIFPETLEAVKTFTEFLAHLGKIYHLTKRGEYNLN